MSEFTKGPWNVGMSHNNANAGVIYKRNPEEKFNDKAICSIYGLPVNTALSGMGRWVETEDMANAHLIAAAPDMYAALTVARKSVADLPILGDEDLAVVDAALAKARGES